MHKFVDWVTETVKHSAVIAWKGGVAMGIAAGVDYLTKQIINAEQGLVRQLIQYLTG